MAQNSTSDPISKDVQGSHNPIPLSPQCLLPKPGPMENHAISNPSRRSRSETVKISGDGANFDQRRESKWNTRWGPNEKEPEGLHGKWSDLGKDGDIHVDKGLPHGKEEKEVGPWRPNFAQSRGRVEPPHSQSTPPNKQASTFSYGRGRGENTPPPVFSPGLGRGGSSLKTTYPGDKVESEQEEPFRYNRKKLLDVYRVTNMGRNRNLVDDFVQVPSLTHDESLEPLALTTPNSEELSVLNGIEKGEIVRSSAAQGPKEVRGSTDFTQTRRMNPGITLTPAMHASPPPPIAVEPRTNPYDFTNPDKNPPRWPWIFAIAFTVVIVVLILVFRFILVSYPRRSRQSEEEVEMSIIPPRDEHEIESDEEVSAPFIREPSAR